MNARAFIGKGVSAVTTGPAKAWAIGIVCLLVLAMVCGTVWRVVSLSRDLAKSESNASAAIAANLLWQSESLQAQSDLATCQAHWSASSERGTSAVTEAQRGSAKAATDFQFWMRSWDLRGDTCAAALIAMEDACASSLSHY